MIDTFKSTEISATTVAEEHIEESCTDCEKVATHYVFSTVTCAHIRRKVGICIQHVEYIMSFGVPLPIPLRCFVCLAKHEMVSITPKGI
jgi:hypothetical protein